MDNRGKGIISGLIVPALICGGIYVLSALGLGYSSDPMMLSSGIYLFPPGLSWVVYFGLGAILWGNLFALLASLGLGPFWIRGIMFGGVAWLLSAAIVWALEPTANVPVAVVPAVLHLLFGLTLGLCYRGLLDEAELSQTPRRTSRQYG